MISSHIIESLINYITIGIAYCIVASIAGYIQTAIATKMGDDTAERNGFLTLNPLMHIDPLGMFFLLYVGIGWTQHIPINPANIRSSARLAWAQLSQISVYFVTALISLIALELMFGTKVLPIALPMITSGGGSLHAFNTMYPTVPSSALVVALMLVSLMYISILLILLDLVFVGIRVLFQIHLPEMTNNPLVLFLISYLAIVSFGHTLKMCIVVSIYFASTLIAYLLGIA